MFVYNIGKGALTMQHKSLFVFDIETVPDTDSVQNLTGFSDPSVTERRAELERYHLEITQGNNAFPRQPLHRVVAISFLEAEIEYCGGQERYYLKELRSGGEQRFSEDQLLQGFFQYFEIRTYQLNHAGFVSFYYKINFSGGVFRIMQISTNR